MEKGSLVEQALHEGIVDFSDKRIQFTAAQLDRNVHIDKLKTGQQLFEVDLGSLKSHSSNEVHIDNLTQLKPGQNVIDDFTNTDGAVDYKLVMVGRKISGTETDGFLKDIVESGQTHSVSSEVFHESGERFT